MSTRGVDSRADLHALVREALEAANGLERENAPPQQQRASLDRLHAALQRLAATLEPPPTPEAARAGPRVLLVEDNLVNQRVARTLLAKRGYTVEVAADGVEAVEATARSSFDAVLMDCQMPRMDGYEATATIRAAETSGRRLPIIAMTANAGPGARERCVAAGMDDFVAKPIGADALDAVLRRWLSHAPPPASRPSAAPRPSSPPIDLGMLRRLRSAADPVSSDIVSEVIAIFQADAPRRLDELRTSVANGELDAAARAAHTLRGSASHLGAKTLGGLCGRFEDRVRAGAAFDAAAAATAIADELARVQSALNAEPRSARATMPASSRRGAAPVSSGRR